ncbi:MAG TPA: enoyl-CoA hydratase/isomerase family protein [Ktedonobacterales bacterium]|nr:enoyl-CoA hydratase/isomerase family protein [Ktedonobacterales bacterium]
MATLELETMRCEVNGLLARLRLNRPEALNAANWAWVNDLVTATDYLANSPEAHVVIVSGEGRAFCSGLDVKELAQGNLSGEWFATWERGVVALANLDAITIAAVHGYCLGGGLQVALACDLRIASTDAVMSIPAVREGVVAALGPMRLARLIGAGPAKRLCFLGRRFGPEEALSLGLITEVVAPDTLEQHTLALAEELLAIPFTALLHTKRQIDRAFTEDNATLMAEMLAAQEDCLRSPGHAAVMAEYRAAQLQRSQQKQQAQG